ncbi:MAG: cell wall hydrolase [Lachnospiraceae bacterium]|nr:cell wall hydrolase [Lachnospiraceae bacterium]
MLITGVCAVNAKEADFDQELSNDIFDMTLEELQAETEAKNRQEVFHFREILQNISSPERTVGYNVLVNEDAVFLDDESYEILCRIVEAEAGNEDEKGRMLVANVVLNRVESSRFPNTVKGVVFQKGGGIYQFSPVANGRYYRVKVSEETKAAVDKVLRGKDESQGALYFVNRHAAKSSYMHWFDTKCTSLFTYGRHEFFS